MTKVENLSEVILENGVENIYFISKVKPLRRTLFLTYTSSSDEPIEMLCKINEDKFKIKDEYKIVLEPVHEGFAKEEFYLSDLQNLIKEGIIKLLINKELR